MWYWKVFVENIELFQHSSHLLYVNKYCRNIPWNIYLKLEVDSFIVNGTMPNIAHAVARSIYIINPQSPITSSPFSSLSKYLLLTIIFLSVTLLLHPLEIKRIFYSQEIVSHSFFLSVWLHTLKHNNYLTHFFKKLFINHFYGEKKYH